MAEKTKHKINIPTFNADLDSTAPVGIPQLNPQGHLTKRALSGLPITQPGASTSMFPQSQTPTTPTSTAVPTIPRAPQRTPLDMLPFPEPGDRIRADDFKTLSRCIRLVQDTFALSGRLVGHDFGQVKQILISEKYEIQRVMTVFGSEIENLYDTTLDSRKVIQVVPIELGRQQVSIVITEAVDTRRFAPNLVGLTHKEATQRVQEWMGDVSGPSINTHQLVGLTLAEAQEMLSK